MALRSWFVHLPAALLLAWVAAAPAAAQTLGTLRWQTQPYCNVVTLTVVQQGAGLQLLGQDDQCGAVSLPITGSATINPSGAVLGFTVTTVTGRPTHITAVVSLATLAGSWSDGNGNGGAFVLNPVAVSGAPRPAATAALLSATVSSGAKVLHGNGAVSASRNGFVYSVDFNRDITACTVTASVVDTQVNSFGVFYVSANVQPSAPRTVRVLGFNSTGGTTLLSFTLMVACP